MSALSERLRRFDGFVLYALLASLCTYLWAGVYVLQGNHKAGVACFVLATAMWTTVSFLPRPVSPHAYCIAVAIGIFCVISTLDDGCVYSLKNVFAMFAAVTCFVTGDIRVASFWMGITVVIFYLVNSPDYCSDEVTFDFLPNAGCDVTCSIIFLVITLFYEWARLSEEKKGSHFVASVSHELRTPLNGIVCAAELLLERTDLEWKNMQDLGTIYGCGQLMSSLINNVLDAEMFHTKKRYSASEKDVVFDEKV